MPIQVSDIIEPTGAFPLIDATDLRGGFRAVASSVPGGGTPAVEAQLTSLVGGVNNLSQGMLAFDTRTSKFYQLGASDQWAEVRFVGGTIASIDNLQTTLDGLRTDVDAKAPASHTHPVANLQAGGATLGDVVKFDGTNWVAGAITVSGDTYDSQAFNDAVERELLVNLPTSGGNLDIAQESTLQAFSTQVSSLESSVNAFGYLSTYFTDPALPATPGATGGYLKWNPAAGGSWSIDANQITAPAEINGGNATSFSE